MNTTIEKMVGGLGGYSKAVIWIAAIILIGLLGVGFGGYALSAFVGIQNDGFDPSFRSALGISMFSLIGHAICLVLFIWMGWFSALRVGSALPTWMKTSIFTATVGAYLACSVVWTPLLTELLAMYRQLPSL